MNNSIIKKEAADEIMQPVIKISRRTNGSHVLRKNDAVSMLRVENDSLYEEYLKVIKRNTELRTIIEKQQKLINAIYNAELAIILPQEEKEGVKFKLPQHDPSLVIENTIPLIKSPEPEPAKPEPLCIDSLAKRICSLRRKQWQSQKSLIEKTKFLLAIYHAPSGIRCDDLFTACGITRVTGMRYVSFFRKFSMVSSGGTYRITTLGKKFVEGEPNPEWDKHRIKRWKIIKSC
jgi:hypothetical protein